MSAAESTSAAAAAAATGPAAAAAAAPAVHASAEASFDCNCGCVAAWCPCGNACESCFPAAVPVDSGAGEAAVPAAASAPAAPVTGSDGMWEEMLFRRQYAGLPVAAHLRHLSPLLDRALSLYAVYFFFRVRGYVLHQAGGKLGADYAAYPMGGAEQWHAQFVIFAGPVEYVAPVDADSTLRRSAAVANSQFDSVMRSMQISLKQKKTCLYARVVCTTPRASHHEQLQGIADLDLDPASVFASCGVSVSLLRQWSVSRGRGAAACGNPQQQLQLKREMQAQQKEALQQRQQQQRQQQGQRNDGGKKRKAQSDADADGAER